MGRGRGRGGGEGEGRGREWGGEGEGNGGGGEGRRGGRGGMINHHVSFTSECMHVTCHLEMCDVPIGRVWGIPLQSNTGSSHKTVYLTEVLWWRGLCEHEGGAGGGVTHLLEE